MREDLEPEECFSKQVGTLRSSRQAAVPSVPGEAFHEGKLRQPEGLQQSSGHKAHTVIRKQYLRLSFSWFADDRPKQIGYRTEGPSRTPGV